MKKEFIVETSARHIHLSNEHLQILFGKDSALTVKKELSQPGQFASNERLTVIGPKRELANVSILGPVRKETQVELSATDARGIGLPIVIRESGDLEGTPGCKLVGPCGEIELDKGVIVAKRHIHATSKDALALGVADKEIVSVKIPSNGRSLIFGDVVVRVSDSYSLAMHIDTDESNAALVANNTFGEIIK